MRRRVRGEVAAAPGEAAVVVDDAAVVVDVASSCELSCGEPGAGVVVIGDSFRGWMTPRSGPRLCRAYAEHRPAM